MGIGDTVKSMLGQDQHGETTETSRAARRSSRISDTNVDGSPAVNNSSFNTDSNRASKLPSGTGIGTSGRAVRESESQMEHDRARQSEQGIAGYGTDAAAAVGGDLTSVHSGARTSGTGRATGGLGAREFVGDDIKVGPTVATAPDSLTGQPMGGSRVQQGTTHVVSGHSGVLDSGHNSGHTKRDVMPSGNTTESTSQLNPVTHEHVRHFETEDVERVLERDRHVHHVQHHTQPILASDKLPEVHRENVHNVTKVQEQHVNKVEDNTLFEGQVRQHRDTVDHSAKERTIVDKGTTVKENVHHHIHHVIQPVIEKNVVDQQYTHTKIPIHEVTHEAPIVHQSQTHAAIPLNQFVDRGGLLQDAVPHDQIARKVLVGGECVREVDGIAGELEKNLHLDSQNVKRVEETQPTYITTKVTKRTTTVDEPHAQPVSRN